MKKSRYIAAAALASSMLLASCDGLDQYPSTELSSADVYSSVDGYKGALAKIYASYVIRGQEEAGGNADLNGSDPYYCSRSCFNLQECGTDELAFTWANSDELIEISYLKGITGQSKWLAGAYYSLNYIVTLANDFIRNCEGSSDPEIQQMANEARFMRAYAYSQILDFWPVAAFTTEKDPIGAYEPSIATREQLLNYLTSELKDLAEVLPEKNEQYRANKYVAAALLSRIYLNANSYLESEDTKYYDSCITYSEKVYQGGYSLEPSFEKLFNADNYKRTNEIIFSFYTGKDGDYGVKGYGSTTQIICGEANTSSDGASEICESVLGCGSGNAWQLFRPRKEAAERFESGDARDMFHKENRVPENVKPFEEQDAAGGYMFTKFRNLLDDGKLASDYNSTLSMVDLPVLRLAEVYMNEAEAILRGGKGNTSSAVDLVNKVRERAGVAPFSAADLEVSSPSGIKFWNILEERGREFMLEMLRRTDLIRFGAYIKGYNWEWKGGIKEGTDVEPKFKYFPLPVAELSANSALYDPWYK